jgi:hypothetical protein
MALLTLIILIGLLLSIFRAKMGGRRLLPPDLNLIPLAISALLLQTLALRYGSDTQAAAALVVSQIGLLIFAWANRCVAGLKLLLLGLGLNLLVIGANGGLMPISPQMVERLFPATHIDFELYRRLGSGKDILLPIPVTRLWGLSDRFFIGFPYPIAFSLGDVLIAAGSFWLLWRMSETKPAENPSFRRQLSVVEG